jgi:hypothetical protein
MIVASLIRTNKYSLLHPEEKNIYDKKYWWE